MKDSERVFLNGYQTWTYCPEYTKQDRIRGMGNTSLYVEWNHFSTSQRSPSINAAALIT